MPLLLTRTPRGIFIFSHLQGNVQVIKAEGSGLGDQEAKVGATHRLHQGAGCAGRAVYDNSLALGPIFHGLDERSATCLTQAQLAPDDLHAIGSGPKYLSQGAGALADGRLLADQGASSATMTELRE